MEFVGGGKFLLNIRECSEFHSRSWGLITKSDFHKSVFWCTMNLALGIVNRSGFLWWRIFLLVLASGATPWPDFRRLVWSERIFRKS